MIGSPAVYAIELKEPLDNRRSFERVAASLCLTAWLVGVYSRGYIGGAETRLPLASTGGRIPADTPPATDTCSPVHLDTSSGIFGRLACAYEDETNVPVRVTAGPD